MWLRFSGVLGLVLFAFGIVGAVILNTFTHPLMLAHLFLGLGLMVLWFLTSGMKNVAEAKQVVAGRHVRFGINALLYTGVFLGILGLANYYAKKHDQRWDLTEAGVYSLAPQTTQVIQGLGERLKIVAVKDPRFLREEAQIRDLLGYYKNANSDKVTLEYLDPNGNPQLVEEYGLNPGNIFYIEYGDGEQKAVSRINDTSEEALTNAILKLTKGEAKKVYFVSGHGEPNIEGTEADGLKSLASAIQDEHMSVDKLFLAQTGGVPSDAAAVVLAAPKQALLPDEVKLLEDYVDNGGRLLLFHENKSAGAIAEIANHYGISVGQDVVIDQIQRLFAAPALGAQPIVRSYGSHDITRNMNQDTVTIFNIASSVIENKDKKVEGATYTELLKTSPSSWAETDLQALFDASEPSAKLDDKDVKGPVTIAMVYEKKIAEGNQSEEADVKETTFDKDSRVIVFGDTDWILNGNIEVYANRDLILNSINWLVGEKGGVTIRPRTLRASIAPIDQSTFLVLLAASFLVPEFILLFGLFVWWRRRTLAV